MKCLGALLILAAAGLSALKRLQDKRRCLEGCRSLASSLRLLRGELAARSLPLGDAIAHTQQKGSGMGQKLMSRVSARMSELGEMSFFEIWAEEAENSCHVLDPDALDEIKGLGAMLGSFDLEMQLQSLDTVIAYLEALWEQQRGAYPAQRRLLLSVYLAMSCFLVILLL